MRCQAEVDEVKALIREGNTDLAISRMTGIPRRTIADWRHDHSQISPRRGKAGLDLRSWRRTCDVESYVYLLGLFLGDGCISATHRSNVWRLRVTLDWRYPEIVLSCAGAMQDVTIGKRPHLRSRRDANCVDVSTYWKHWPELLPHGAGRKHLRRIVLAPWQRQAVARNPKPLLLGLIHSDGCRIYATERKGSYERTVPRYAFSNLSTDINDLFCEACDAIGVGYTRHERGVRIYRKASVARLDEFIGPKY